MKPTAGRRGRWIFGGVVLLLLGFLGGHGLFWYHPRERPGRLDPASDAGRVFLDEDFELALWLAHPHQNLAVLVDTLDASPTGIGAAPWLAAVGHWLIGDAGAVSVDGGWPGFGPFPVPPATELAVAVGRGEGGEAVAHVHPTLAVVAKLAGRLAGNPWLAGGETREGAVSWRGRDWHLKRPLRPGQGDGRGVGIPVETVPEASRPALAWVRLGGGGEWLPPGLYRLHRSPETGGVLELRRATGGRGALERAFGPAEERFSAEGVVLVWRRAGSLLVVFEGQVREGGLEIPPAAVLTPVGLPTGSLAAEAERPALPQEALPELLRGELVEATVADWRLLASGRGALEKAVRLAPALKPVMALDCPALWLDPAAARRFVGRVATVLEEVPLVSRRDARRWRNGERALAGLEGIDHLRVLCSPEAASAPTATDTAGWALRFETRRSIDNPPAVP